MPLRKLWRKRFKLNNRGSAIVTVIVVTIFITIVATTMLFISGRNYIMKQTDYQNTRSFYSAEETLDKLKELLVAEVDEAYDVAYRDMMRNYAKFGSDDERFRYYADSFTDYLYDKWQDRLTACGNDKLAMVKHFMEVEQDNEHKVSPDVTKLITKVGGIDKYPIDSKNSFIILDVEVYYVDDKGFSSYLTTNIALTPPDYKAETAGAVEPEKMNMSEYVIYVNWKKN